MRNMGRDSEGRSVVVSTLMILTCLVLGLLAGGMLVIGVSLVSFWKSLSPSDFQTWFASHAHLVARLMIPLGVGGTAVTVAAVVACWRASRTARRWLLVAAVSAMGVMVTYPLFFEAANEAFGRGGLSDSATRSLLDRWVTWHWFRTGLGAFGFFAALRALHG
jgi:zinc transporter ZupT